MRYQADGSNLQPQPSVLMDAHGQHMVPSLAEPVRIAMCELLPTGCTATLGETPLRATTSGEQPTSIDYSVDDTEFPHTPPRKSPASVPRCADGDSQLLPLQGNVAVVDTEAGENLVRIRAQLAEKHFTLAKEAEARRPDYFKRMRRAARVTDGTSQDPVLQPTAPIGITNSPAKGRCLTLFQETSEESFEESLMAGGYGRYRSDALPWGKPESEVPSVVDVTEDPTPMVERERKKKRLAAFRNVPVASSSKTQLVPTEIEGCGRVLIRMDAAEPPTSPKRSPSKGRRSRRKKKVAADGRGETDGLLTPSEAKLDAPNWPDMHFPWGSTSMPGRSQDLEEERLRHIENFLTRDSDEEAEEGSCSPLRGPAEEMQWTQGKTYRALRHTEETQVGSIARSVVPNDPADARVALLSKKSVKELSLRLLRRRNTDNDGDGGEVVCICNEPDDERDSVQCDACQIWYHLDCIGIRSTSELGREEDPWFCANCAETKTPPPVVLSLSEPTFVPTDDKIIGDASYDLPFLQAGLNPSPTTHWTSSVRPPKTPPGSHVGFQFSSGSSLDEPASRGGPHTPQFPGSHDARVYTTPGQQVGLVTLEESPFDPTSTPSRGIKFGAPFATPKNGLWQGRQQELFHTPMRPGGIGLGRQFGQYGFRGVEDSAGHSVHAQDITPVVHHLNERGRPLDSPLAGKRSRHSVDNRLSRSRGS
ncbi:hypothetical protein PISMIDRAFT_270089 [Pisolithus microcarpus 441]|uniref:Unplaced genomic scaffold scaffold_179, whole genome shotgun sequence n=1 Tax=Pisolithus microcarpus 441 TaxID=765257 RepID=A0A0C9YQZ4_9AGAM|nr:hypothetical protein PISMIDRAFT_270089 [Pisolithus microcarpus 441]